MYVSMQDSINSKIESIASGISQDVSQIKKKQVEKYYRRFDELQVKVRNIQDRMVKL